ncbi:MAG: L-threonine 3-dehydrogenase [Deltaproteobacteria bacterium]|nr:L-threonine 3-dehydrogenase [Deltaproteobacteria bacterium]
MRALCKTKAASGAQIIDAPIPKVSDSSVLVNIKAASICGTDVHIYNWDNWAASRIKPPLIFGHECAGIVTEIGKNVRRVAVGDHVSIETHIPCETCHQCRNGQMHLCKNLKVVGIDRPGGFAEYLEIPEICCVKNDPTLPWEVASIQEPLGNAVYTVDESNVAGKSVAIFGDGPIGVFAVAVARAMGAKTVIACGMQPFRLELMRSYHPDHVIDVRSVDPRKRIAEITDGLGVDVVLEMSGSPKAIHDGLAVVRSGGTFTFFGVPSKSMEIDVANEIIFKGITMHAIYGRRMFETWDVMKSLIASGKLDVRRVVTHEFSLAGIDEAMKLLTAKEIQVGKILLRP